MSKKRKQEVTWWLDRLNLRSVLVLFRETWKHGYRVREIRYFRKSQGLADSLAKLLVAFHGVASVKDALRCLPYDLSVPDVEDAEAVFWHAWRDREHFGWNVGSALLADRPLMDFLPEGYDRKTIELYLKKEIANEQRPNIAVIRLVMQHLAKGEILDRGGQRVLVSGGVWGSYLKEYAEQQGLRLHSYHGRSYLLWSMAQLVYSTAKILKHFLVFLVSRFMSLRNLKEEGGQQDSRVAVFYAHGVHLDRRSDLFWLLPSGIDPKRVVIYFLDPSKPPTPELVKTMESIGVRWRSLLPWWVNQVRQRRAWVVRYAELQVKRLFRCLLSWIRLMGHLPGRKFYLKLWQFKNLVWLLDRTALFESLFESENVRVHFGLFSEDDGNLSALDLAAQRQGAVDIYVHWSNHPESTMLQGQDVYFTWGCYFRRYYDKVGHHIRYLVYCGYPFDGVLGRLPVEHEASIEKMRERGVRFVVCFFDNTYWEGGWFSKESLWETCRAILEEAQRDPSLGVVFKPKKAFSLELLRHGRVKELMEELEAERRCLVLESQVMPRQAAECADLAIGFGAFNSAALEAAIGGTVTITFDPSNHSSHPFYEKGFGKFVFNDLDQMLEATRVYRRNPGSIAGFGDYAGVLSEIDPFRDGKTAERIGRYMKLLLDVLSDGSPKDTAIGLANERYCKEFGEDKVVEYVNGQPKLRGKEKYYAER